MTHILLAAVLPLALSQRPMIVQQNPGDNRFTSGATCNNPQILFTCYVQYLEKYGIRPLNGYLAYYHELDRMVKTQLDIVNICRDFDSLNECLGPNAAGCVSVEAFSLFTQRDLSYVESVSYLRNHAFFEFGCGVGRAEFFESGRLSVDFFFCQSADRSNEKLSRRRKDQRGVRPSRSDVPVCYDVIGEAVWTSCGTSIVCSSHQYHTMVPPRRVVLTQGVGGSDTVPRRSTVDVQVKEGESSSRRNTIDLLFKEGSRSRKNTLELKVNGEVVATSGQEPSDPTQPSPKKHSRTLSILRSGNASPTTESQRSGRQVSPEQWKCMHPTSVFYLLKTLFVLLCLVDIVHWAYLLRDDSQTNPNSWRFYKKFESFDLYYLVARMFGDIFTCVLGLGAAMWTRKRLLTFPCTTIQLAFLFIRAMVWGARSYNMQLSQVQATAEDKVFVVCEFVLPSLWALLSISIVFATKTLLILEQRGGYAHPPIIVLTVKNDDNDESVQIEIA